MEKAKLEDEGIWVDQQCIKQNPTTPEEKAEQMACVAAMNLIYVSARRLVIVLEDIFIFKEDRDFALAFFEYIRKKDNPYPGSAGWNIRKFLSDYATAEYQPNIGDARSLYENILGSWWFQRTWCHHEIRCSLMTHDWSSQPRIRPMGADRVGKELVVPILWKVFTELKHFCDLPGDAPYMDRLQAAEQPSPFQMQVVPLMTARHPDSREIVFPETTGQHSLIAQIDGVLPMRVSLANDKI